MAELIGLFALLFFDGPINSRPSSCLLFIYLFVLSFSLFVSDQYSRTKAEEGSSIGHRHPPLMMEVTNGDGFKLVGLAIVVDCGAGMDRSRFGHGGQHIGFDDDVGGVF